MSLDTIRQLVSTELDAVNTIIIDNISSQVGLLEDLSHHIVENGGKRLRPILLLLSAKACNYAGNKHLLHACAVEYFHTATLLHDDVLDESTLRRGVKTANSIWGSKASILVGDFLLTQSIQLMLDAKHPDILAILVDCAHQITSGEIKQLTHKHNIGLTEQEYFDVIRSKTALLFQTCAEIGAHLGEKDKKTIECMRQYGLHLGNAFQLVDDALDYEANSKIIGKNPGDDLNEGKVTLPLIYAMKDASSEDKQRIEKSIMQTDKGDLGAVLTILAKTGALKKTYQVAKHEVDNALSALQVLPDSPYKTALHELALFALNRTY